jgi:GTPase involved in cell partitioning and DNA repair
MNELKHYNNGQLLKKPSLIAVNKCDRKYVKFNEKINKLKRVAHAPVIPISAKEGDNLEILLESVKGLVFKDNNSKTADADKKQMKE